MSYDLYVFFRENPKELASFLKSIGFPNIHSYDTGTEETFQQNKEDKTYRFKGKLVGPLSALTATADQTTICYTNSIDIRFHKEPPEIIPYNLKHEKFISWAEIEVYGIWGMQMNEQMDIAKKLCEKYDAVSYNPQSDKIIFCPTPVIE